MHKLVWVLFACGNLLFPSAVPALAQNQNAVIEMMLEKMAGTLSVRSQPQLREGNLVGCQLVYGAAVRDWSYRQGQYLKLNGAIGIMVGDVSNPKLGAIVKVVVEEIEVGGATGMVLKPAAPDRVYLVGSDFKTNIGSLVNAVPSDVPGGLFAIYQASPTLEMVMLGIEQNKITIAFNKAGGASDIQMPIELDVADTDNDGVRTRSPKAVYEFTSCLTKLGETLKSRPN